MNPNIRVQEAFIEEAGKKWAGRLIKLDNALLIFYNEGDVFRLGTLAVAMPDLTGKRNISSVLFGERNGMLARMLAERLSVMAERIVLVSIHLPKVLESVMFEKLTRLAELLFQKVNERSR